MYYTKTDLGDGISAIDGINSDPDGNYISDNRMPWAISIIHDFKVPKEGGSVDKAYNYFVAWATSDGASYSDWYKDNTGYRNSNHLDN